MEARSTTVFKVKVGGVLFTFFFLLCFQSYAQEDVQDNIVGKSIALQSKIMADERTIEVYLPDSYEGSEKDYPVLYLLDGQRYFLHGVSLQKSFVEFKQTQEFIIVGISKNPSDRNRIYTTNSRQYLNFIEREVIDYVENNYRVSQKRLLFGWAFAGGFVMETMITKPDLFDAYIASSPFPIKNKIPKIDSLITVNQNFSKMLFFSSETSEGLVKEGTEELLSLLKECDNQNLNWVFKELAAEGHRSTPYTTLYHGIAHYFYYFPEIQFNSLEDFSKAGGLAYVHQYYQQRAVRYGFSNQPSDWTMFSITRNAMRANDFEQFELLVNEFNKTGFIERLRVSRSSSIAEFYLQNQQFDQALKLFSALSEKHPTSERLWNGLGDTYKGLNDLKKADFFYRKAQALSDRKSGEL